MPTVAQALARAVDVITEAALGASGSLGQQLEWNACTTRKDLLTIAILP
jgi:hypothetical protein